MSSSRVHCTRSALPGKALARIAASRTKSGLDLRPKPPPSSVTLTVTLSKAIPSRSALQNNAYFKKTDPGAQNARLVFAGADDGNVRAFTFGPQAPDRAKPINEALASVLSGQRSAADALKKAQADMTTFQRR